MKHLLTLLILIILATTAVSAQQEFFLRNKKTGRLKKLRPKTNFVFDMQTIDGLQPAGYFGKVIAVTDSTVTIEEYIKPSLREVVTPQTWIVRTRDIKSIKNRLIDNDDFNTIGAMLVIFGVLGTVATPIVWISDGREAGEDGAAFTATLFGAGGLLLLPQFVAKRKNMAKWEFVKGQLRQRRKRAYE